MRVTVEYQVVDHRDLLGHVILLRDGSAR